MQSSGNSISRDNTVITWLTGIILHNPPPWPKQGNAELEERIWHTGQEHGVLPLCSYHLHNPDLAHAFPETLRKRLKDHERRAAIIELLREQEIKAVLDRLTAHNIQPLLLKGCPLAYTLYPEPWLRFHSDTDFFFCDKDTAERAWNIVKKMGYERPSAVSGKFVSHEFSCYRPGPTGLHNCLDFHWQLSNSHRIARVFSFAELMENAISVPVLNDARTPNQVHALLYACLHRLSHAGDHCRDRLIWLYDIHLLAENLSPEDWQQVRSTAQKKQIAPLFLNGIEAAVNAFSTQVPQSIINELKDSGDKKKFSTTHWQHRGRSDLANIMALDNWHDRLLLIREHLFPSRRYMLAKYRTTNRLLLPLLYILRILQGIPKLLK